MKKMFMCVSLVFVSCFFVATYAVADMDSIISWMCNHDFDPNYYVDTKSYIQTDPYDDQNNADFFDNHFGGTGDFEAQTGISAGQYVDYENDPGSTTDDFGDWCYENWDLNPHCDPRDEINPGMIVDSLPDDMSDYPTHAPSKPKLEWLLNVMGK